MLDLDKLPDVFYTDEELAAMDIDVARARWYRYNNGELEVLRKRVTCFALHGPNGNTKKIMILATVNVQDSLNAVNRSWDDTGIFAVELLSTEYMACADDVADAIRLVLDVAGTQYETKFPTCLHADLVYTDTGMCRDILLSIIVGGK